MTCACCQGACCNGTSCTLTAPGNCVGTGVTFRGVGTTCSPNMCIGYCCYPDGQCMSMTRQVDCDTSGGTWLGFGSSCSGCTATAGACCVGTSCMQRTQADCLGIGGTFRGVGTSCSPNPCVNCNNNCITHQFSISGLSGSPCTNTTPYGQITVQVPADCPCVTITGSVDDDLAIDGVRVQAGMFTTPSFPNCNPAHSVNYSFRKTGSFTLAALDNYGGSTGYNVTICFGNSCSGALSATEPVVVQSVPETKGPGTEMKKLLAKIGITSSPDCQCNARARYMDEQGPEWCEQNMAEIIGWLREEAEKRKLPFVDFAGRLLVKKAIANARKNGQ